MFKKFTFLESSINSSETNIFFSNYQNLLRTIQFEPFQENYQSVVDREINKAYLRVLVRYDTELNKDLIKQIKKKIISTLGENYKKYFITSNPYLLLHLPKDSYENGRYHTDIASNTGHSITCWLPINNYSIEYSPLTVFPKSQDKFNLYILKITSRISQKLFEIYANIFLKKFLIGAKPNKIFFWLDSTIHRGNYNFKEKIHSALTFKITEKKNPVEKSDLILTENTKVSASSFSKIEFLNNFREIKEFIEKNKENRFNQKKSIENLISSLKINKNSPQLNTIMGFATGIIGQRLFFSKFSKQTFLFNLISLNYIKYSNDNIYLKKTFGYLYLKNKLTNLDELIK